MPRGSHKGCLFAISGRATNAFGRRRKRGLYHHCTNELFRPSWGPVRQPSLLRDANLPNWSSGALSPDEKLPPKPQYHRDARMAWPVERLSFASNMYRRNMQRYFKPVEAANDDHIRKYISKVLGIDDHENYAKMGIAQSQEEFNPSRHIAEIVKEVNTTSGLSLDLKDKKQDMPIFKRLESLIIQSDAWRTVAPLQESSTNPFPHVNESASLVRNLALSEVLHTRSNHRLARRAHPKWYTARYRKFMDKRALQEKLMQLKLETGA